MNMPGIVDFLRDLWTEIGRDRVLAVAAGVTFYALLAVFPAITALVSIFGLISSPASVPAQLADLTRGLPVEAATLLTEQAQTIAAKATGTLSIAALLALLIALWSAMGGVKALMEAVGIALGVQEKRGFVELNLTALAFTMGGIALVPLLAVTVALLPLLAGEDSVLLLLRWPIILGVLLAVLAILYRWGPDLDPMPIRWISPGAVAAALGLVATSAGFGWYAANFGSYDETYGSLAAVVVLMLWIWLSTVVVLVGAEVNAALDRRVPAGVPA